MTSKGPACMTADEWVTWNLPVQGKAVTGYPCFDCPASWYAEMRAAGTCDGEPQESGRRRVQYPSDEARERRRAQWRAYRERKRGKAA